MTRINTYQELREAHDLLRPRLDNRLGLNGNTDSSRLILVCGGTGCHAARSQNIVENLQDRIAEMGLEETVSASISGCFGFCEKGPVVKVFPDDVFYVEVQPEDAAEIVDEHIVGGRVVERLLYEEPQLNHMKVRTQHEMGFYKKQQRIALRNCGLINPEDIREYIAHEGYLALGKALTEMTPEEVIEEIKGSGLRGRGGGGFLTGLKWELTRRYASDEKFIICNADEGDPGAFMDRAIMEGDAHAVLEGMAIAGYAVGANMGYIYIRAEYPLAIHRLEIAMAEARQWGFIGKNILGSGFDFDVEIKFGAGAFVCGEETALIHSIEGERGEPTNKPPYPAQSGLWGKPTVINNVETLANIARITLLGGDWYGQFGTESSKGTKVFALAGQINNVGLVEVPMGIPLREIIYDIGGGLRDGAEFKAVQTGGPSGGCIPAAFLDTRIDYESLKEIGSMMGSGGMIVMSDATCMVNIAKFYLEFTVEESCGRCTPCRIGNKRMLEILERITDGRGTERDLDELKDLSQIIMDTSLCGLGQTAPNPIVSTMQYFWDEYEAHVNDKRCPAGTCAKLIRYLIDEVACKGCTACARVCPVNAITGKVKELHVIDQDACIKCGACMEKCRFGAISRN
jgi:NADH-quinone oxidoreductase subunit F